VCKQHMQVNEVACAKRKWDVRSARQNHFRLSNQSTHLFTSHLFTACRVLMVIFTVFVLYVPNPLL
jgi:hypothetical protein